MDTTIHQGGMQLKVTFPDAFSNAATISRTEVPFPVPKLYTSQPKMIDQNQQKYQYNVKQVDGEKSYK